MPEKSAFMFHCNFHPKPKIDPEDIKISGEIQNRLQVLEHDSNDLISQNSSVTGFIPLQEMTIETEINPCSKQTVPFTFKTPYICKRRNRKSIRSRTY